MAATTRNHPTASALPNPPIAPLAFARRGGWAVRAGAFFVMLAVGWLYRCNHLTDWDSWDYSAQAIMGHASDLALGRWWFIAAMRGAWRVGEGLFGIGRAEAFVPMQIASAFMMGGAVVAGMAWTRRLTGNATAELLFAAMVVGGPVIGLYTFSVMTEPMTLLTLSLAMWAWEVARGSLAGGAAGDASASELPSPRAEGPSAADADKPQEALTGMSAAHKGKMPSPRAALWALAAGLAFGVAVDVREPVLLAGAWPIVSCLVDRGRRRWRLLAAAAAGAAITLGVGIVGAWAWYPWMGLAERHFSGRDVDVSYFAGIGSWMAQMAREKAQYHVSIPQNLAFLFTYWVCGIPVAAVLALPAVAWAALRFRKGMWLAVGLLPLAALLVLDHTLQVNPRHPLPLIWLLAPVAAAALERWAAAMAAALKSPRLRVGLALGVVLAGNAGALAFALGYRVIQEEYFNYVDGIQRAYVALRHVPSGSAVVTGPGTPAAYHLMRLKEKDFDVIASGWAWPENVGEEIDRRMRAGKPVYVYWEAAWDRSVRKSTEWDRLRQAVSRYRLEDFEPPYWRLEGPMQTPSPGTAPATAEASATTGPRPLP